MLIICDLMVSFLYGTNPKPFVSSSSLSGTGGRLSGMSCCWSVGRSVGPFVFVRVLMGIVSRAAVVAPDRERRRETGV